MDPSAAENTKVMTAKKKKKKKKKKIESLNAANDEELAAQIEEEKLR